jgi:hypothetical protein
VRPARRRAREPQKLPLRRWQKKTHTDVIHGKMNLVDYPFIARPIQVRPGETGSSANNQEEGVL